MRLLLPFLFAGAQLCGRLVLQLRLAGGRPGDQFLLALFEFGQEGELLLLHFVLQAGLRLARLRIQLTIPFQFALPQLLLSLRLQVLHPSLSLRLQLLLALFEPVQRGVLALLLTWFTYQFVGQYMVQASFFNGGLAVLGVLAGALIWLIGSAVSVGRHLNRV